MIFASWLSIGAAALFLISFSLCKRRAWLSPLYWGTRYLFCYYVAYPLAIRRRRYWSSITVLQVLAFVILLGINAVYVAVPRPARIDAARRLGRLAALNMIPLFLSHSNPLMHLILPLHVHRISHHWIGRLCVAEALTHSTLMMFPSFRWTEVTISGVTVAVALACISLLSLHLVRILNWEIFTFMHRMLALITIAALIWHLYSHEVMYLALIGPSIWLLLTVARLFLKKRSHDVTINKYYRRKMVEGREIRDLDVIELIIRLKKPIAVKAGQHVYLRVRDGQLKEQFQRHPFMITWWESPLKKEQSDEEIRTTKAFPDISKAETLTILVQPASGFTRRLANRTFLGNVSLDGPYGQELNLQTYNNVLLVAKGIGIVGVLSYAKQLLAWKLEPGRRVVTRKVDVYWELDDESQEEWIAPYLRRLQKDDDTAFLLQIWCFWPRKPEQHSPRIILTSAAYRYIYPGDPEMLPDIVKKVVSEAAGRNIIVACGVSPFTYDVRSWTRATAHPSNVIDFVEVEFRPSRRIDGFDSRVEEYHQLSKGKQGMQTRLAISRPFSN